MKNIGQNGCDSAGATSKGPRKCGLMVSLFCVLAALGSPALAEDGCAVTQVQNPLRQVITCGSAMTIEREPAAEITIFKPRGERPPRRIDLLGGGLLVTVTPGAAQPQIRTPHAIAAVRGTTYVVDAAEDSTTVFVIEGRVEVRKADEETVVSLGPGDGIDVYPDRALVAAPWAEDRVNELLARFAR